MSTSSAKTATALLELAHELDAAERRIKEELLRAVEAGDLARVTAILHRWLRHPAGEVLAAANPLGSEDTGSKGTSVPRKAEVARNPRRKDLMNVSKSGSS